MKLYSGNIGKAVARYLSIVLLAIIIIIGLRIGGSAHRAAQFSEIAGYWKWTKVNGHPTKIDQIVAQQCAAPNAAPVAQPNSPHRDRFINVYVNDIGRAAMMAAQPQFPIGAVIVKEKMAQPQGEPELLTVMIKRAPGFNPEGGDWEYLVFDGSGEAIEARGQLANCQTCHSARKSSDYVFRTYYK
jgi:hypothetical protein